MVGFAPVHRGSIDVSEQVNEKCVTLFEEEHEKRLITVTRSNMKQRFVLCPIVLLSCILSLLQVSWGSHIEIELYDNLLDLGRVTCIRRLGKVSTN